MRRRAEDEVVVFESLDRNKSPEPDARTGWFLFWACDLFSEGNKFPIINLPKASLCSPALPHLLSHRTRVGWSEAIRLNPGRLGLSPFGCLACICISVDVSSAGETVRVCACRIAFTRLSLYSNHHLSLLSCKRKSIVCRT
jgi:hypothetical protein